MLSLPGLLCPNRGNMAVFVSVSVVFSTLLAVAHKRGPFLIRT